MEKESVQILEIENNSYHFGRNVLMVICVMIDKNIGLDLVIRSHRHFNESTFLGANQKIRESYKATYFIDIMFHKIRFRKKWILQTIE